MVDLNTGYSSDILAIICLALSPIVTFFGAKHFRIVATIIAFFIASYGAHWVLAKLGIGGTPAGVVTIIIICAGLAAAALIYFAIELGVYIIGAFAGVFLLGNLIFELALTYGGGSTTGHAGVAARTVLLVSCALICALLAHHLLERAKGLSTGVVGGYMMVGSLNYFAVRLNIFDDDCLVPSGGFFSDPTKSNYTYVCWLMILLWAVISFFGVIYQWELLCCRSDGERGSAKKLGTLEEQESLVKPDSDQHAQEIV